MTVMNQTRLTGRSQRCHIVTDLIELHLIHCQAAGLSAKTIVHRRRVLERVDLAIGLETALPEELEAWLAGYTGNTLCSYSMHLRSFYKWAAGGRSPHLSWNPMEDLTNPRSPKSLPRPTSEFDLALMLRRAAPRWQLAIRLGAFAGLRAAEIAGITRNQITQAQITAHGKGDKVRSIPTHPDIWSHVNLIQGDHVITDQDGRPFNPDRVSKLASAHMTEIGLPAETLHRLRHRFATMMLMPRELGGAGADVRTVQELMGHASLATTQIYALVTDMQRRNAVAHLPSLEPKMPRLFGRQSDTVPIQTWLAQRAG